MPPIPPEQSAEHSVPPPRGPHDQHTRPHGQQQSATQHDNPPAETANSHQRQGDRASGDDASEAERAAKLAARRSRLIQSGFPVFCRFDDLVAAGIVQNWTTLLRLIDDENFPPGTMIGANTRAWRVDEIEEWLASRPSARKHMRCRELKIPDRFAPSLHLGWCHRGYGNALESRRKELRRMSKTQVEAIERKAIVQIELSCLEAQTALAVAGLTSDAARQFIEKLPTVEALMPRLAFAEVAGEAEPPIAEQLVSSNALRQRRYRERLRNGNAQQALRDASAVMDDEAANFDDQ